MAHLHSTPSDKSASTAKPSSNFADKRGIRFNPHVTVQSESNTQWDLADSFNNLNIRDPNVHNRHGSQSDSSADSATVVTPIPSKDGEGDHTSNTTKDGSPFAPNFHPRSTRLPNGSGGFQYRQANGAVPAGRAEDIPPNEFGNLPRPFIPNNAPGGQRGGRPPASYGASQGVSPTINNPSIAPGVPFYPQVNPQAPYPGAGTGANLEGLPPNEAAAMIINNAIQQAVAIAGPLPGHGPGAPLNPAAIAAAYASPHLLGTIYSNPSMYGQTPGNAPFYQPRPNAGGESMQTPPPGLANFPSPGMAPLQQAGYSGQASNDSNTSPTSGNANGLGPSANNRKLGLYKTELCRSWEEKGSCRYGPKCQFAHGEDELRRVARHPKYKTEICRTFWVSGSCPHGQRCCFLPTELPAGGGAPGDEKNLPPAGAAPPPPPAPEGRPRSDSRNSDSDQQPSMLTRIKRNGSNQHSGASTPPGQFTEANTPGSASFGRGPLRVDTGVVDANTGPKEAYPFTSGPAMPGPGVPIVRTELPGRRSPGPVTAGPDFGRHTAAARLEVVGSNSSGGRPSGHLRSVSQTFPASSLEPSSGRHSPAGPGGHLRSDSWSAVSAFAAAPSSAIDPPSRFSERNWN